MSSSLKEIQPSYFQITPGDPGVLSARLTVDLNDYITASLEGNLSNNRAARGIIRAIRSSINNNITGLGGALLWEDMLECALRSLSELDPITSEKEIAASAAGVYMSQSFIELVKNSMDQIVLSAKEPPDCVVQLDVLIEFVEENIRMTFSDNGGGFSEEFMRKINDEGERKSYIDENGSTKLKKTTRAELFGGAGKGLRILCSYIEYGDKLTGRGSRESAYTKPDISTISLENNTDARGNQGATIVVETSKSALCNKYVGAIWPEGSPGGSTTSEESFDMKQLTIAFRARLDVSRHQDRPEDPTDSSTPVNGK